MYWKKEKRQPHLFLNPKYPNVSFVAIYCRSGTTLWNLYHPSPLEKDHIMFSDLIIHIWDNFYLSWEFDMSIAFDIQNMSKKHGCLIPKGKVSLLHQYNYFVASKHTLSHQYLSFVRYIRTLSNNLYFDASMITLSQQCLLLVISMFLFCPIDTYFVT